MGDFGLATRHQVRAARQQRQGQPHATSQQDQASGGAASVSSITSMSASAASITGGCGTPFYSAPEQNVNEGRYDHKADMYSLGVVLFEMFRPPFDTFMERAKALSALATLDPRFSGASQKREQTQRALPAGLGHRSGRRAQKMYRSLCAYFAP